MIYGYAHPAFWGMYSMLWSFWGATFSVISVGISAWLVYKLSRRFSVPYVWLLVFLLACVFFIYGILWQVYIMLRFMIFLVALCAAVALLIYVFRSKKKEEPRA